MFYLSARRKHVREVEVELHSFSTVAHYTDVKSMLEGIAPDHLLSEFDPKTSRFSI